MKNIPEREVIKIWQHQLSAREDLITESGEPIEIIYPGMINTDKGADFRDAVIMTKQGLRKGDIEVHVKSSDWRYHRHHLDPAYNRVILHVAMFQDSEITTNLQNGKEVPVLALNRYLKTSPDWLINPPCSVITSKLPCSKVGQYLTMKVIVEFLDKTGEERFLTKAARFQADLAQIEAGQSLYQGLMGALGYSKNEAPFQRLARSVPLRVLESITQSRRPDREGLLKQQAILFGSAGLLPSQTQNWYPSNKSTDRWVDKLEGIWASSHHIQAISPDEWQLFKIRPNNSPLRRLAAIGYLTLRYRKRGLLEGLVNLIREASVNQAHRQIEKGFLITVSDYWAGHYGFDPEQKTGNSTLLGVERAADIIINVLLPFTFAWGQFISQPELKGKVFDLYQHYHKSATNSVVKHMISQVGLDRGMVNSAQRQQGLIHIYRNLCTQGKCGDCRLGQL